MPKRPEIGLLDENIEENDKEEFLKCKTMKDQSLIDIEDRVCSSKKVFKKRKQTLMFV